MRSTGFFWTRGLAVDLEMLGGKELADAALAGRSWPPSPALRTLAHQDFSIPVLISKKCCVKIFVLIEV